MTGNVETTITGSTIIATIKNMSALGHIGQKILLEQGVDEIKPDQQYPYTLRSDIHEAAHKRFGDDALFAFGFFQMEAINQGRFVEIMKVPEEYFKKNIGQLDSEDEIVAEKAAEEMFGVMMNMSDSLLKKATVGPYNGYGCYIDKIDRLTYEMHGIQAARIQHEANFRGAAYAMICLYLANNWDISIEFDREKSKTGDGWTEYVYKVGLTRKISGKSLKERWAEIVSEVKESLLKAVLADSEKQTEKTETIAKNLGKYLPPQIHNAFLNGNYDTDIATRRKKLTIFFSDIKNFTSTSEDLQPEDLTKYLNEYFSEMTTIALTCGATIDKYIGDAMMVFFGDPESRGERADARGCVEMALKMQERMLALQGKWRNEGFANPFQVRMGMNTGYCNVGNFGSDQRLTYTIIGGEVNVAQRLESASEAGGILMSYETYAHAQDMVEVEERDAIKMKGINREIKIYSVIQRRSGGNKKKKESANIAMNLHSQKSEGSELADLSLRMEVMEKNILGLSEKMNALIEKNGPSE